MEGFDLGEVQRLAVAQALYSAVGEEVAAKGYRDAGRGPNLRQRVDSMYRGLYGQTHARSFEVVLGGTQVGTYSVRAAKAAPPEQVDAVRVEDRAAYRAWLEAQGAEALAGWVVQAAPECFAEEWLAGRGEVPGGCRLDRTVVEHPGGEWLGGTLKVDPAKVAEALGEGLPAAVSGLLREGAR